MVESVVGDVLADALLAAPAEVDTVDRRVNAGETSRSSASRA